MFTMVPSSTTISCATEMRTSAQMRRLSPLVSATSSTAASGWVSVIAVPSLVGRSRSGAAGRGRQDDLVDDAGDEVLGRRLADHEEAVQHDAGQGRREELDVDVVAD